MVFTFIQVYNTKCCSNLIICLLVVCTELYNFLKSDTGQKLVLFLFIQVKLVGEL